MTVPACVRTPYRCARNTRCANAVPITRTDTTACPCTCHGQGALSQMCSEPGGCGHLHVEVTELEGGPILHRAGLCEACATRVARAVAQLPDDYVQLHLLLAAGESGIESDVVTGSRELPVPIRLSIEALQAAMVREARLWAAQVAQVLNIGWDTHACRPGWVLQRSANLLTNGIGTLLGLEPLPYRVDGEWVDRDGIDGALELLRLHDQVRFATGKTKLIHELPAPCPRCEAMTLIRHNGSDQVECQTPGCDGVWSEESYTRLTMILAEDYRDEYAA